MANLQKTLDALQPYVIGIRYLDGIPVVDTVFKDGWTLPDSNLIDKAKGNDEMNYYMLFSNKDGIGLDELLEYVSITIKVNVEKEKKHELLKVKVNELKELFKKTSLAKLQRLVFSFDEEDLMPVLSDLNLDETNIEVKTEEISNINSTEIEEQPTQPEINEKELTDEELEILEEEKRAENYKKIKEQQKSSSQLETIKNKVELPPKKTIQSELKEIEEICDCGPYDACAKCIDKKDL